MAAASSECSSGCQSGWTTYLDDDDHSSHSCGTARFHGNVGKAQQPYYYYSEEEDLSMISDASSGPRHQQCSAGNDVVEAAAAATARRARRVDAASARRQSKKAAAAASLLEDTASSPAFFGYSKASSSGEVNGYGYGYAYADEPMTEFGNAADFSSATTGFKTPLNGTPLDGYLQMQYPPAPAKPMPTRQGCRDGGEKTRW